MPCKAHHAGTRAARKPRLDVRSNASPQAKLSLIDVQLALRKERLEAILLAFDALWRPSPFRTETPDWCAQHPQLTQKLLALTEAETDALCMNNIGVINWLAEDIPALAELAELIRFPLSLNSSSATTEGFDRHLACDIPGRKLEQIHAFTKALGRPVAPLLEWCAGKGHLGRMLAWHWHHPVASLEIDPALCEDGQALTRKADLGNWQEFIQADALSPASAPLLAGRQGIALHACGDLHRQLILNTVAHASPALDFSPCCYYKTRLEHYLPLCPSTLQLSRDDLRLAVTEQATASRSERDRSKQENAYKLGWQALRQKLTGDAAYRQFKPIPACWMRMDFPGFATQMALREGVELPQDIDFAGFEALGLSRAKRMWRLQVPRLAFRRALEAWLVCDMGLYLSAAGYTVTIREFCSPHCTPRNLLISARRRGC